MPLQIAVWKGHKECVKALLDQGADLEAKDDEQKRTPLFSACEKQDLDIVLLLIERGACINAKDRLGRTPLHLACWFGDHPLLVETLLAKGADRDAKTSDDLTTALHCAAQAGRVDCMRVLLESGSEVESKDKYGRTTLLHAVAENHLEPVRLLLNQYGASPNSKTNRGLTPLHFAKSAAVAEELLRRGANIFERTNNTNRTPFDHAIARNRPAVSQCNLNHYREKFAETHGSLSMHALFKEANYVEVEERRNGEIVRKTMIDLRVGRLTIQQMLETLQFLLLQNRDMVSTSRRSTPLHILCKDAGEAPIELMRWLVEQNLQMVNNTDSFGRLPLHLACHARASAETVRYLVEQSPGTRYARDHDGSLPLHLMLTRVASATTVATNDDNAPSSPPPKVDAVEYLIKVFPGSVPMRNGSGKLPFLLACQSSAPTDVLFVLLKAYPEAIQ